MADDEKVVETVETPVDEAPKYTDKQLNDLIAKKSGKASEKAQADLLAAAGVKSVEELQELSKLRASQMTESEKSSARIKELEESDSKTKREAEEARAETEALKRGVLADKSERVMKLALSGVYEGSTISEKVAAVLAEFPEMIKAESGKAFGGQTDSKVLNKDEELRLAARKVAGLK